MDVLRLNRPLTAALRAGHPWVYRKSLESGESRAPGRWVRVVDQRDRLVGYGISDAGAIGVRLWTTREEPFRDVLARRLRQALELRATIDLADTTAWRALHGEGDRCPGVVLDRYGGDETFFVLRLDGEGAHANTAAIEEALIPHLEQTAATGLLLRTRGKANAKVELRSGKSPPDVLVVREHGMELAVSLRFGQKTGLFLDHRETRRTVRGLSSQRRVLNLYGYTGGFSVAAGLGQASRVVTVDIAAPAIALAEQSWNLNQLPDRHTAVTADVPTYLEQERQRYDLIVADPPNFAPNEAAVAAATESYKKLHRRCLERLADGGIYVAASCSSHIAMSAFLETIRDGARQAKKVVQVLTKHGAPMDHPRLLAFPEGDYLKVVICRLAA